MTKKILITGGLGTVGKLLNEELVKRNFEVYLCDLFHCEDEFGLSIKNDPMEKKYIRCDISQYRQLLKVFEIWGHFDYVYNCAAEFGRWNGEDYYENLWNTNVIGLKNILRLQKTHGFKLIHFSSSEVYGDWNDVMVEHVLNKYPIIQMNDYAMTKWVNEMQIHNSIISDDLKTVIIRLFNTYGPGEYYSPYRSVNCRFLYSALMKRPWIVHKGHKRTSIYINDAINTISNIVDNFVSGEVYNIGGNELHSIEDLSNIILEITKSDPNLVSFRSIEKMTTTNKIIDITKAEKHLNHKITIGLKEGMKKTYEWMKKTYITQP